MPPVNKQLLRLAAAIHARLATNHSSEPLVELPNPSWQRCNDLARQSRRARLRGWQLAAVSLENELRYSIQSLQHELTAIVTRLTCSLAYKELAKANHIYADLVALGNEFELLAFDCKRCQLSVSTEPIILRGLYLGPFEIRLFWGQLHRGDMAAYRVVATDPHPAESRNNVTHPHVMDEILCEGDGRHAIRSALLQGRLFDFFSLVAAVLRTYNQDSPFVELSLWSGSSCSDCGAAASEDETYSCETCGETMCSECETLCASCERGYCSGCISSCAACKENSCSRCLTACQDCHDKVCPGCLDENERCPNCHEEEPTHDTNNSGNSEASCVAAVQSDCMVQAAFSA